MYVGFKTGIARVELARELQILDDNRVDSFAGNQQRNARRVRGQQHAGDAPVELVDRHAIDLAVSEFSERIGGTHGGFHGRNVHFRGQPRDVVIAIGGVNLRAQIAQADALILRIGRDKFRHDAPQRLIGIVVDFELLQLGHQAVPTAFGDADGEHHEE